MGVGSTAAHIELTVQIVKGDTVLDEFKTAADYSQGESGSINGVSLGGYSGSSRLGKAAEKLGEYAADYMQKRTKG